MEIIELSGYSLEEKVEIAKRHLLPFQLKEHGLKGISGSDNRRCDYFIDSTLHT